ncbi:hypothetical protein HYPSUDRAFT_148958 [Hypholoma sublateritium FD-334 SS-4]|uniref:enoyl-[acyl-carrier-protein] reductase n=1 Tax=Hypholoma sublateritium (strain FD-334 SS-4) TaxID=945553 RepID=A0A0D2LXE6_HYPSF|nr:hypothetical protein HYPSUDRAFT_148958 [Hypholoma sublateritium FD-334 SS-4]
MFSLRRPPAHRLSRLFATSAARSGRAVVYAVNGDPATVLRVRSVPALPPPPAGTLNLQVLLAPINPADLNVVEGVYPSKPRADDAVHLPTHSVSDPLDTGTVWVGGNEGVARVSAVGPGVSGLGVGDWVILTRPQAGTWAAERAVAAADVARVPDAEALTEAQAATLTVNPPTAYNMLSEFIDLAPGDWVVQNGANSAVGQAVIQIAKARGLNTLNLVRHRPEIDELKQRLHALGATQVLTYDELADKSVRDKIKAWTGSKAIRLGLNCVGGKDTALMARLLGADAHLVSYGAMAKQPLSLPTSLFIFKNLKSHGFWQTRWYSMKSAEERAQLMQTLVNLIKENKLDTPAHEVLTISAAQTDEEATEKLQEAMVAMSEGRYGKKLLLKIE